jgi:hypothetical protein
MIINGVKLNFDSGIHTIANPKIGGVTTNLSTGAALVGAGPGANILTLSPYIPNVSYTCSNLYLNVRTQVASTNARILIYSDLEFSPDTKLYESANLNCSTSGVKTATTSFAFVAGITYWLAVHTSGTQQFTAGSGTYGSSYPVGYSGGNIYNQYTVSSTFGSAPTTITSKTSAILSIPIIFITVG